MKENNSITPIPNDHTSEPTLLMGKQEAARRLGVSEKTLDNWASSKAVDLIYVKIGRLRKYRECDLQDFINKNLHGGAAA